MRGKELGEEERYPPPSIWLDVDYDVYVVSYVGYCLLSDVVI